MTPCRRVPIHLSQWHLPQADPGRGGVHVSVPAAGIGTDDSRDILVWWKDQESWQQCLTHLKSRGPAGVQLIISDKCLGLVEAAEFYPAGRW